MMTEYKANLEMFAAWCNETKQMVQTGQLSRRFDQRLAASYTESRFRLMSLASALGLTSHKEMDLHQEAGAPFCAHNWIRFVGLVTE